MRWIEVHPRGFVINCEPRPSMGYLVLHRADCLHISVKGSNMEHWTYQYIKVSAERNGPLLQWRQEVAGGRPTMCSTCTPVSPSTD
ncbi:MAG: hypothetical protein H0W82_01810 [Actinobacteria bacterium]|nr:hypothetical protein [Actinomycetota bacterium]